METVNENNLSTSDCQDFDELNTEELQEVAGGGALGALAGAGGGGLLGIAGYVAGWGFDNITGNPREFDALEATEEGVKGAVMGAAGVGLATLVV